MYTCDASHVPWCVVGMCVCVCVCVLGVMIVGSCEGCCCVHIWLTGEEIDSCREGKLLSFMEVDVRAVQHTRVGTYLYNYAIHSPKYFYTYPTFAKDV